MITFHQQKEDSISLEATASFLNFVMKKHHFSGSYIRWQYLDNPLGKAIAICAYDDDKVVGHYSAQPMIAMIDGTETRGLFILNAAVDPESQGKGLLRGIADRLHEEADQQGYRFMIGVGNKNSTPIYTKKFGFRLISPLDVKIGFGLPASIAVAPYYYERCWDEDSLKWRLDNPFESYLLNRRDGSTTLYKKNYPLLSSILGTFGPEIKLDAIPSKGNPGLKLFIGIDASIDWSHNPGFFNFPEFAKPSPLNLIFKELNGADIPLTRENILFRCIDFDAF